jgi:hypothetical protein
MMRLPQAQCNMMRTSRPRPQALCGMMTHKKRAVGSCDGLHAMQYMYVDDDHLLCTDASCHHPYTCTADLDQSFTKARLQALRRHRVVRARIHMYTYTCIYMHKVDINMIKLPGSFARHDVKCTAAVEVPYFRDCSRTQ